MIRLFTTGTRVALFATVVATAAVSAITFAQTTESAIESAPAAVGTEDDTSAQSDPPIEPTPAAAVEVEIQRRFNELQRELLDDRGAYIDRWLAVITIALAFFGLVAVVCGYIGFKRFREIETDVKQCRDCCRTRARC